MRSTTLFRWLATAFAGIVAVQAAQTPNLSIPGGFIFQCQDDCDLSAVLNDIKLKHDIDVRQELRYKLFKGAHILVRNVQTAGNAAAEIRAMEGIKEVWPSSLMAGPKATVGFTDTEDAGQGTTRKRAVQRDTYSPHVMTQVNLLRDAGYLGKGFKIATIASGVDYLHPALGGGFGPNHTVSFGKDLVGDHYNGTNDPVPDDDPLDTCYGYGTAVAGIIAAQPDKNPYGIVGAATAANIGAYRVFSCQGWSDQALIIAAFHQAFEDGADVIHASVGQTGGWPEHVLSAAVSPIVAHGVPCTVSAGDDGREGLFYIGDPAVGVGAAAVGTINNVLAPSLQINATYSVNGSVGLGSAPFGFTPSVPIDWTRQTLPLWTPITNISDVNNQENGCDPYPDTTPNLGGYIVLVPRGGCSAVDKANNAARWGAKHVLLYNNVPGTNLVFNVSDAGTAFGLVTQQQGVEWVKFLLSGAKVDVHMVDQATAPTVLTTYNNTQSGGYMNTKTNWGPSLDLGIKPQFSAPGNDILSTYPRAKGGYTVKGGTTYSGPLVAAMYVLLMESTGIRDPGVLGRMLSSTAKQLDYHDGSKAQLGQAAPVAQQGAGMVQVFDASRLRTIFDVDSLAFNDTDHFVGERNFTIVNTGNDTLQYRLDHTPALTAYYFDNDTALWPSETEPYSPRPNVVPNELVTGHATLEFTVPTQAGYNASDSPASFSIPGGKKRVVSVRVTKPPGLDEGRVPVWSGFIRLTGNDGSKLSLPYQGVSGSMHSHPVLEVNNTGISVTTGDDNDDLLLGPRTFLLPPAGKSNLTRWALNSDTTLPEVQVSLPLGSRLLRADLIPVDVVGPKFNLTTILGTTTAGSLAGWPQENFPRGIWNYSPWDGQLADGTYVPDGVYKISIKALRVFGDPAKKEDYDQVETFKFGLRYAYDI